MSSSEHRPAPVPGAVFICHVLDVNAGPDAVRPYYGGSMGGLRVRPDVRPGMEGRTVVLGMPEHLATVRGALEAAGFSLTVRETPPTRPPTTASLSPAERNAARATVAASALELVLVFRKMIEVDSATLDGVKISRGRVVTDGLTPGFTGMVTYDSWYRPDTPWGWSIIDRRAASADSGIGLYGSSSTSDQFLTPFDALTDLVRGLEARYGTGCE